jgi:hypothetical protein
MLGISVLMKIEKEHLDLGLIAYISKWFWLCMILDWILMLELDLICFCFRIGHERLVFLTATEG